MNLSNSEQRFLSIEAAARTLSLSVDALRMRCRRHAVKDASGTVSQLGPGIVALKFGSTWRVAISMPTPLALAPSTPAIPVVGAATVPNVHPISLPAKRTRARAVRETVSRVRYNVQRRKWIIDIRYFDASGVRRRYRHDATTQTATEANSEAERLAGLARATGRITIGGIPSFADFVSGYFRKAYLPSRCRPSTVETYVALLRQGVLDYFGAKRLDRINATDVREYAATLTARGIGTKSHCSLVRSVLRAAVEAGYLAQMPKLPKVPMSGRKLPAAPTVAMVDLLLDNSSGWARVAIALGAFAGLRAGEVLALEVRDVDLVHDQLLVRRALSADTVLPPKSGHERVVPLVPQLRKIIATAIGGKKPLERVVERDHGRVLRRQTVLQALYLVQAPLIERGLLETRWSFHQLRHFFCSELVRRGASVEAVRLLAGHTDLKTTQRYVHACAADLREAVLMFRSQA